MPTDSMTTVIGGGVIGLATSYALVREGHFVTLVERHSEIGQEASFANGGQLSYRYVSPLADAGVPKEAVRWLFKGNSPILLKPQLDLHQWRWLMQFLAACNRTTNRRNTATLLDLALSSQKALGVWRQGDLKDFSWRRPGKLVLYRDGRKFAKAANSISEPQLQQVLSAGDCASVEPTFADLAPQLAGGIFSPEDEVADCRKFCESLLTALLESPRFKRIQGSASLSESHLGRCKVSVDGKPHDTDHVVLAAGLESRSIARRLGISLPLYPLKGYSLTQQAKAEYLPQISVTDYENRVVYARLGNTVRIAAMVDIGARNADVDVRRIRQLRQMAAITLPQAGPYDRAEAWAGLRPATPTGVPIITRTRYRNLILNVGHGALGFTLSAGSGIAVRDLINA